MLKIFSPRLVCSTILDEEKDLKEQKVMVGRGRIIGGVFGHLKALKNRILSNSEDGILKDFTLKAIGKAQNIIKDSIKTGVLRNGKI